MIDHLVLATDDLERTVADVTRDWGVTPTPGGSHEGRGTRNELVAIGRGSYLEIIGPDLDQPDHTGERPFGVEGRSGQALAAWCAQPSHGIEAAAVAAVLRGHHVGPIATMSRRRPDGGLLEWRLTFPAATTSVLPFLIDWLNSEHPTKTLNQPVELLELQLHTPAPVEVRSILALIGDDRRIAVYDSVDVRLVARLQTPAGQFTLSS
ncbi:MAG: hypothetical protein JWN99_2488 [Ilumatobacteraceae bacterium]|nr:hypothetical protein [Ilumatobacteraceae bacterium]